MKKVDLSRKVALRGQKINKKVNMSRKVALQGQKNMNKINMSRKVALRGQKFMKKVNMARKVDLARKSSFFLDRFKMCFDTAKSKISKNAAIPAIQYCFTKQKHIRGEKNTENIEICPPCQYLFAQTIIP